jgi:hypothetical protein
MSRNPTSKPRGGKTTGTKTTAAANACPYTAKEVIDGFANSDFEPSEFPDRADKVIGSYLDWYDDEYWALVDRFWDKVRREASDQVILDLYNVVPNARDVVREGLENLEADDDSADGSEEEAKPVAKSEKTSSKPASKPKDRPSREEKPATGARNRDRPSREDKPKTAGGRRPKDAAPAAAPRNP